MRKRGSEQGSFGDLAVSHLGGPKTTALLQQLDAAVPWKAIVREINKLPEYDQYIQDPSHPGERPIDPLIMLKCLLLAKWFNLSDPGLEELLQDRISFRRFVGLSAADDTPDQTTFCKFRSRLREANLDRLIFQTVLSHIEKQGLLIKNGTIVDATIIEQSKGHDTGKKDENGEPITTRDPEAGFTKKHGQSYHGYKMHAATDLSGIITGLEVSSASDHDSQHIDELIEKEKKAVWADSAYSDQERRDELERKGVIPAIIHKRKRGQAELCDWQKRFNRIVSRVRALGEHPFAWMKKLMQFERCRYRGLRRNTFDFTLTAAAYNLRKAVSLLAAG